MAKRKVLIAAALAGLIAVTALLLARDWNAEATRLARQAEQALGIAVTLDGPARLTLLPPALSVDGVHLGDGDAPVARAERLSVQVSPWSLLTGSPRVTGIALERVHAGGLTVNGIQAHLAPDRVDGFFKLGGHAVTFTANLDRDAAKLRLSIPTLGSSLRFDGVLEPGPVLAGHVTATSGTIAALPAPGQVRAEADLELGEGQVSLVNLIVEGQGSRAGGSLLAVLGDTPLIDADLDVDRLDLEQWRAVSAAALPALLPAQPSASSAAPSSTVTGKGGNDASPTAAGIPTAPQNVLANLRLKLGELRWQGQTIRDVDIRAGLDQGTLVVRHAEALAGSLRVNLDGVAEPQGFAGRLRLNGPGLSGRADLAVAADRFTLDNLWLNRDGTFVKGRLGGHWDGTRGNGALTAEWSGSIGTWADTAANLRLRPTAHGAEASELSMRIGTLALRGQASADFSGPRPRLEAQLRGDEIDLHALPGDPTAVVAPSAPRQGGKTGRAAKTAGKSETPPPAKTARPKGGSPFSTKALDWSGLRLADGRLVLNAAALVGDFGRLEQVALTMTLADGTATIEDLRAAYLGGNVTASGTVSAGPLPSLRLKAKAQGLDLSLLKPSLSSLTVDKGRLEGDMSLAASGKSSRDMAANAHGSGRVEVRDGSVDGLDLAAIDGQLAHIENIGNVLTLVQTGLAGGRTPFQQAGGPFTLQGGVVHAPELSLKATGGTLGADLSVDLPRWSTETTLSLALASMPATPIVLRLSGPVDAPRKVVDANALQKALVQSGLGRALGGGETQGKGTGKVLKNLFRAFGG